jgi:hypothetical protein
MIVAGGQKTKHESMIVSKMLGNQSMLLLRPAFTCTLAVKQREPSLQQWKLLSSLFSHHK